MASGMGLPSKGELKKNLKILRDRLETYPMDLDARMRIARTYRLLDKREDAVAHYGAVARYLSLAGHPLQAIAVLKELLQVDPSHEETLLFLAKLYARTRAADASNRGRVAVPISDGESDSLALSTLQNGIPMSATGIWRAIRPTRTDDLTVVHAVEDLDGVAVLDVPAGVVDDDVVDADAAGVMLEDEMIPAELSTGEAFLPTVPLFAALPPAAFVELSHAMLLQRAATGAPLFSQGDRGDSCIVVASGTVRVVRETQGQTVDVAELHEGDIAGVFALMQAETRQATLIAETPVDFFEIDKLAMDQLMEKHPAVRDALKVFFKERLLINLLAALPFFANLSGHERRDVAALFTERTYEAGTELFFEGAEHDGIWVILEGVVVLGRDGDSGFAQTLELRPGDYVGSFAGIDAAEADFAAQALERTRCSVLTHKSFSDLLDAHPDFKSARATFEQAGVMVGAHVFAGNGTWAAVVAKTLS